jgi:hypothetical protein
VRHFVAREHEEQFDCCNDRRLVFVAPTFVGGQRRRKTFDYLARVVFGHAKS